MKPNLLRFLKMVGLCILLNLGWALTSPQVESLRDKDRGFATGLGFLVVYGWCFYLFLRLEKLNISNLSLLTSAMICIFLFSSFVIVHIFINMNFEMKDHVDAICRSLFSAVCIVFVLRKFYDIHFPLLIIALTF